jgi:tRNA nucleotidyltransferase (CCA-adding enzyme)
MFKGITYLDSKKREQLAVEAVIRIGLKLGTLNHYMDGVPLLFAAAELLKNPDLERFTGRPERVSIGYFTPAPIIQGASDEFPLFSGLLLRDKVVHNPHTGTHWTTSILFTVVQELVPSYDVINDTLNSKQRECSLPR